MKKMRQNHNPESSRCITPLVGLKIRHLTVIGMGDPIKYGGRWYNRWRFICDCGRIADFIPAHFIRGNKKSCGWGCQPRAEPKQRKKYRQKRIEQWDEDIGTLRIGFPQEFNECYTDEMREEDTAHLRKPADWKPVWEKYPRVLLPGYELQQPKEEPEPEPKQELEKIDVRAIIRQWSQQWEEEQQKL